jgi:hypothetical protein
MAKPAKQKDDITDRVVEKFIRDVMEQYEAIASAQGVYMNRARKSREAMQGIYEGLAQKGISQKAAKVQSKVIRSMDKIKGWMTDLEIEDRKMVERLAKMRGDKKQLLLFGELPQEPKPVKEKPEKRLKGISGEELGQVLAEGSA